MGDRDTTTLDRPLANDLSSEALPSGDHATGPVVGMLWGDFPWEAPPPRIGKLLSTGVVARNVTRALGAHATVVPFVPPADPTPTARAEALADFLGQVDVLWADVYPATESALRVRHERALPCRVILYAGGALPKGAEAMLFPWQRLLRPGDGLLVTSAADRAIWRRLVARSSLREWVVPLAVDDAVFRPRDANDRRATRREHGLPLRAPLLLYVGRFNVQKNLHALLRLFAEVRRAVPDAHLGLVGEDDDIGLWEFGARNTGYVAWLRALAADLGVADGVTFHAPLFGEDLARLYAAADVCVNLSFYHRENFGLAQAEAQACGTPVVCTAWGGFQGVLRPGETGYLVDAILTKRGIRVDWRTGAERVVALLRDEVLRSRLGARAAVWARAEFAVAALARRLAGIVGELASAPLDVASPVETPAYVPSAFARRYEAHKRVCGWYATAEDRRQSWYPAMFQGRDYALYETLLGPYATGLASDLPPTAIRSSWVPYRSPDVALDPPRQAAIDADPIWPGLRYLSAEEWSVLRRVDGSSSVAELADSLADSDRPVDRSTLIGILWQLFVEGYVLFGR